MIEDSFFRQVILDTLGQETKIRSINRPGSGCINNAASLDTDHGTYFVKYNSAIPVDMFENEARGLSILRQTGVIGVPEPLGYGKAGKFEYLLLERIVEAPPVRDFWPEFGKSLARLHKLNSSPTFGLDHDNYIGRLPQRNSPDISWSRFFIENRLEFQLKMAVDNRKIDGDLYHKFQNLFGKLPDLLPQEPPALLHGDLWSGNFMVGGDGKAVVIDPAVYFGNREAELAFTRMFGGFNEYFYEAYHESWPLEKGFDERVEIYNLYPGLVHLNMFGAMYLQGIRDTLSRYV
ncbi:MAG TPA: fructosamine kinase family protein [Cyclobacteriaceae bacterium]|nr:fructosamine kinase family protein [Cyclobacteriaceae bacterium]